MRVFYIGPTHYGVGLTSVTLGLLRAFEFVGVPVRYFKPISQATTTPLHTQLTKMEATLNMEIPPSIPLSEAEVLLGDGHLDLLLERITVNFHQITPVPEVILVEGVVPSGTSPYLSRINAEIARALSAEVILLSSPMTSLEAVADKFEITAHHYGGLDHDRVIGYIINKLDHDQYRSLLKKSDKSLVSIPKLKHKQLVPIGYIPLTETLRQPRVLDIQRYLGAEIIYQGDLSTRRVTKNVLCDLTAANITQELKPGNLIITPGDRDDIMLATAMATANGVTIAGILLTNNIRPTQAIIDLCTKAVVENGLPVLLTKDNGFETVSALTSMPAGLPADDVERIEQTMNMVAEHIDINWLKSHCEITQRKQLSPSAFRYQLTQRAKKAHKKIVLPEGEEPRTIEAAAVCQNLGLVDCILLGNERKIHEIAAHQGINLPKEITIISPDSIRKDYVDPMIEIRKKKGLQAPLALAQLEDNVVLGTMMLQQGKVDGLVSGAIHTTSNTIRPAFQLIKTKPGVQIVSSVFFMLLPDQVLVYGDCAVNPDPDAEQLADIAIQSADSAQNFGIEPIVAMISYSTGSSGQGKGVDKVRLATEIARAKRPDLLIDGPLQYDAASVESVAKSKAPDSEVAGRATVFIFPDLNTGNTTYKAVQRSANVISVGPMLQGLRKPVNDLSRGALVDDIVLTILITAVQAAIE